MGTEGQSWLNTNQPRGGAQGTQKQRWLSYISVELRFGLGVHTRGLKIFSPSLIFISTSSHFEDVYNWNKRCRVAMPHTFSVNTAVGLSDQTVSPESLSRNWDSHCRENKENLTG